MKKLLNKERSHHLRLLKFDLKMKLSALFIFVVFFTLQANNSYSQKTKVSLNLNNASISQIIDEIESNTEFRFVYKIKDVNLERNISINVSKESITNVLNKVFSQTNTSFSIVNRQIFLIKKEEPPITNQVLEKSNLKNKPLQSWKITGTVLDDYGQPLPGANVLEKGSTNGTQTDFDGTFYINVPNQNATLVISYIGFISQEIPVNGQTNLSITLQEDVASLEEVILVGYGTQKRALITGASVQISGDNLTKTNTTNALQGLQGQTAGVQITSTSGQPGESLKVTIRGIGSTSGSNPIYVVDGIITDDISYLNNSDIESISVLKDAASAAIYGSQASNGVVLVSTKKGKRGTSAKITFNQFYGLQNLGREVDLLNAPEYAIMINEAAVNSGKTPYFSNAEIAALGNGTNWIDELFVNNAAMQNYTFGASGGSENSIYSTSMSYLGQEGIVGGKDLSNYERYNFRINTEHNLYDEIVTIGQNLSFAYIKQNGIGVGNQYNNSLRSAFQATPLLSVFDNNGDYTNTTNNSEPWFSGLSNPYASLVYNNQNEKDIQKLLGNVYLKIEPIKGLVFKTTFGIDYYSESGHSYRPEYELSIFDFRSFDEVSQNMSKKKSLTWDNLLSYEFDIQEKHSIKAMVGTSSINFDNTWLNASNADVVFNDLKHGYIDSATNSEGSKIGLGGGKTVNKRFSYFGRLTYNFDETYLLNATLRADASSNFHPDNQWGYFPSVSAGWVVTNESFFNDSEAISFFKLRASWGQVGNQNVDEFQYIAPIRTEHTNYTFGDAEGALTPGAFQTRFANPDIRWETSEQTNIGFDARLFNNALAVNFDWYKKTNKDWIIMAPQPATAGAEEDPFINGGNVENTGIELALQYNNSVGDFRYSIAANGAYNKNEVGKIPTADGIIHGATNQLWANSPEFYRAQEGLPIGYFLGLKTAGVFQNESQIQNYTSNGNLIQPNAQPGDIIYQDISGNGSIGDEDKTNIGDPNPDFTFGFSLSANYKAFDFNISANGVAGNQVVQSYRNQSGSFGNYTSAILNRWHGEGSSNTIPRVTEDNRNFAQFSDLFVQDGDFLRINTVTVGVDLAKIIQKKSFFASEFRFYISVLNLHTFTKYNGMDPEIGFGDFVDDDENLNFSSGVDVGYYPRPRTFMMGLNVKL
ncbi:TonB-dependent receptor [Mariniflexile litorale]|uniref:TonB-dependent receptor n=1 Tax=Mariniflexile litorale TaxID=3045158 RepID=A0AAU7EBR5_9FLAO|nr:TonB-dependent receptor [Mariniflexile sp. KMM 9835]MDQ8210581.1 TonB-dependent receptor [Mariniflexile sp. KMM 9835]